jgi:hypothetical protein
LFAKEGFGTHFNPRTKKIACERSRGPPGPPLTGRGSHVPLGGDAANRLRIVGIDTGTVRHGLEKSTYAVRADAR